MILCANHHWAPCLDEDGLSTAALVNPPTFYAPSAIENAIDEAINILTLTGDVACEPGCVLMPAQINLLPYEPTLCSCGVLSDCNENEMHPCGSYMFTQDNTNTTLQLEIFFQCCCMTPGPGPSDR